jgi:hypothetical protein
LLKEKLQNLVSNVIFCLEVWVAVEAPLSQVERCRPIRRGKCWRGLAEPGLRIKEDNCARGNWDGQQVSRLLQSIVPLRPRTPGSRPLCEAIGGRRERLTCF